MTMQNANTSVLLSINEPLCSVSVTDLVQLVEFSNNQVHRRPVLMTFNTASDASAIITKKFKLQSLTVQFFHGM